MLRAILSVGLLTIGASVAVIAFAPISNSEPPVQDARAEPQLFPLGGRETLAELRPSVESAVQLSEPPQVEPVAPAVAAPSEAASAPPPLLATPPPAPIAGQKPIRNVTPQAITAPPSLAAAPPVRQVAPEPARAQPTLAQPAPKPPLAQPAVAQPGITEPPPERLERLFNPVVTSAGILKLRDREVRLVGIEAPDFEERCGAGARQWPCGRMARAALRRFIRGRAIECAVPAGATEVPDPATCSVAGTNLSEWLVGSGWARQADLNYVQLEAKARERKLGLWAEMRPDNFSAIQPAELAVRGDTSAPASASPMRARLSPIP